MVPRVRLELFYGELRRRKEGSAEHLDCGAGVSKPTTLDQSHASSASAADREVVRSSSWMGSRHLATS